MMMYQEVVGKRRLNGNGRFTTKNGIRSLQSVLIGQVVEVLIEQDSSVQIYIGQDAIRKIQWSFSLKEIISQGFCKCKITDCTTATLIGEAVGYSEIMQ